MAIWHFGPAPSSAAIEGWGLSDHEFKLWNLNNDRLSACKIEIFVMIIKFCEFSLPHLILQTLQLWKCPWLSALYIWVTGLWAGIKNKEPADYSHQTLPFLWWAGSGHETNYKSYPTINDLLAPTKILSIRPLQVVILFLVHRPHPFWKNIKIIAILIFCEPPCLYLC